MFEYGASDRSIELLCDSIHVVICEWDISSNYAKHAGATIISILENSSLPITVHIFHSEDQALKCPEMAQENISKYLEIGARYNCHIEFHDIKLPEWVTQENRPRVQTITPAALFRLYIPKVLTNVDYAIYLDCDMIVNTDLANLFSLPLSEYSLAACLDQGLFLSSRSKYQERLYKSLGINRNIYFNSGFMVLNLNRLRCNPEFPDNALEFLRQHPELPCLDQEALNWLFQTDCYHLDPKYNVIISGSYPKFGYTAEIRDRNYHDCILHFAGNDVKPWVTYSSSADFYYWKYLSQTPWYTGERDLFQVLTRVVPTREECILKAPNWILSYSLPVTLKYAWYLIAHTITNLLSYYVRECYKRIIVWKLIIQRKVNK